MKVNRWSSGLSLVILVSAALALWQWRAILDWWRLRGYQPPARVVQLADATTMNSYSRKVFYVNHPALDDKVAFNGHCRVTEESIVLGCYVQNQGIYIFDVQDPRLNGVHEVTAAHEMLHAAYERLSGKQRQHIDKLLTDFFATIEDQRIIGTMAAYKKRDPGVVPNELHSVLGTEVRSITPELETYYARFFVDRLKIVEFSEHYEKAFTDIKNKVAAYDAQLNSLKAQINANEAELQAQSDQLNADRAALDTMLSSGNTAGYNAAVASFNQKVRQYNSLLAETRSLIDRYNQLVKERNQLAAQEQELIQAIDTRVAPQKQE